MNGWFKDGLAAAGFLLTCFGAVLAFTFGFIAVYAWASDKSQATPARLIGLCNGQVLAAMEEDQFPEGCDWIEPIHFQKEFL